MFYLENNHISGPVPVLGRPRGWISLNMSACCAIISILMNENKEAILKHSELPKLESSG